MCAVRETYDAHDGTAYTYRTFTFYSFATIAEWKVGFWMAMGCAWLEGGGYDKFMCLSHLDGYTALCLAYLPLGALRCA